jgi:hypothetical protein
MLDELACKRHGAPIDLMLACGACAWYAGRLACVGITKQAAATSVRTFLVGGSFGMPVWLRRNNERGAGRSTEIQLEQRRIGYKFQQVHRRSNVVSKMAEAQMVIRAQIDVGAVGWNARS